MINLEKIVDDACELYGIDLMIDKSFRDKLLNFLSEYCCDDCDLTEEELRNLLGNYIDEILNDNEGVNGFNYDYSKDSDIDNLSNEELVELYFNCDESLKKEIAKIIIQKNERFNYIMAKRLYWSSFDNFDDLMQAGRIGILKSLYNYDFSKAKGSFLNFASYYIKTNMWEAKKASRNLYITYSDYSNIILLSKVRNNLTMELGRIPTTEELADKMSMSVNEVVELLFIEKDTSSFNACVNGSKGTELIDLYVNPNGLNILEYIEKRNTREQLNSILDKLLTASEAFVIKYKFGFIDNDYHTLDETAVALAKYRGDLKPVSHQRISQIYNKAVSKLTKNKEFLEWGEMFDGYSEKIDIKITDYSKLSFKAQRLYHRRLMKIGTDPVSLLQYYMCTQDILNNAILSLSSDEQKLFYKTIGSNCNSIDFDVLKQSNVDKLDKKLAGIVSKIAFNYYGTDVKESKVLSKY